MRLKFIPILCLLVSFNLQAKQLLAQTNKATPLLELYTSEGCSSCPPADQWFGQLKTSSKLWSDFVPIAFHVPYWDYIGHKDRFADQRAEQRQRAHARRWGSRNVYTPEVVLAGEEWRGWRGGDPSNAKKQDKPIGTLKIWRESDGSLKAESNHKDVTLYIAQLSFSEQTVPKRGENAGKHLAHDFVIKQWTTDTLTPTKLAKSAVVAWIEDAKGKPLQATGAWLNH